jgi:choline-sulfatase
VTPVRAAGRSERFIVVAVAACAILLAAALIWKGPLRGRPPRAAGGPCRDCNVFIVVMDALRPDHLGCYGYGRGTSPNIDAFAASSIRFERVVSASSWTKPAITSVLTGKLPSSHGVFEMRDTLDPGEATLQRILARAGYSFAGFVANKAIDGDIVDGFVRVAESLKAERGFKAGSAATTDAAVAHLERASAARSFVYVHYMDTHAPYFTGAGPTDAAPGGGGSVASYDAAIRNNDAQVGRLFDAIRRRGMWDRSIVVLMADHGEAFGEHGKTGHYNSLYEEETHIPFLLHVPGAAPRVVGGVYSEVDITPTLLAALGLPVPGGLDGIDMLSSERSVAFSEMRRGDVFLAAARTATMKLIFQRPGGTYACFDLAADPGETSELTVASDGRCAELRRALDAHLARAPRIAGRRELTTEERRQLKALGYLDGGPAPD